MKNEIEWNDKERKLIKAFPGTDQPASLSDLARVAYPSMGARSTTKGNSWVRNSLRKPIKFKFVKQLGRGLYVLLKNPLERPKKTSPRYGKKARTRKNSAAKTSQTRTSNGTHVAMATSTPSGASEAAAV